MPSPAIFLGTAKLWSSLCGMEIEVNPVKTMPQLGDNGATLKNLLVRALVNQLEGFVHKALVLLQFCLQGVHLPKAFCEWQNNEVPTNHHHLFSVRMLGEGPPIGNHCILLEQIQPIWW